MKDCPEGKDFCPCPGFSKEGLCDWPYRNGMSFEEARYITEILRGTEGKSSRPLVQERRGRNEHERPSPQDS